MTALPYFPSASKLILMFNSLNMRRRACSSEKPGTSVGIDLYTITFAPALARSTSFLMFFQKCTCCRAAQSFDKYFHQIRACYSKHSSSAPVCRKRNQNYTHSPTSISTHVRNRFRKISFHSIKMLKQLLHRFRIAVNDRVID